ncbi:MAG: cation:proton antiporter [Sphingopyxis sp.]
MEAGFANTSVTDALIILGAAGVIIPAFARLRITPVIGFILVGIAVGPYGLARLAGDYPWLARITISRPEAIAPFAELGIILLLFSIGLELSFKRLWAMRRRVFGIGAGELFGGGIALALALAISGEGWGAALGLGFALTLSSTALVLPIAGTKSRVGQNAFAMLLFEDLALVPIIFILGALAPSAGGSAAASLFTIAWQGAAMVIGLALAGWFLLPSLFAQAARAKNPELFLSASLLVVITAALATTSVGLSPIVGALLAGLMIAETDYHTEVENIISPFKGLALGVFLLTVGMQVDVAAILANWQVVTLAVVGVVTIKALVTAYLLMWAGARRGTAAEVGVLMGSPSETTLIVLGTAVQAGVVAAETAAFWQVVTAIGLTITPLLAKLGHSIARRIDMAAMAEPAVETQVPSVLIIGFGRVGQIIADMLTRHDQRYLAVDADVDAVARHRAHGYNVKFGDAARARFLDRFTNMAMSAAVLTMDDPAQQLRLVRKLRARYPALPIITRAHDSAEAAALYRAGATDAVPEALEGSLQMAEALLVDIGIAVGPVIASVHDHRAQVRRTIVEQGELNAPPRPRHAKRHGVS